MIYRLFLFLLFFTLSLFGRYDAAAVKMCPAFDNMKHTKNTGHVVLHPEESYTVLQKHKGQMLLLLKGENPAQRWVDEECFSEESKNTESKKKIAYTKHTKKYENSAKHQDLLLALSWHNAFCETHRSRKECQRSLFSFGKNSYREDRFVLHGLWPQPREKVYCNVAQDLVSLDKHRQWNRLPEPELDAKLKEELSKVMPGVISNLHRHEWIKHGTCYGSGAQNYFEKAVRLTEQVNRSKVSQFFLRNMGKSVTLQQVRYQFDSSFGKGAGKRVELRCYNGLISELWLHLGSEGDDLASMLKNGKAIYSRCQRGIVDRAGYGR
ncbi:ribonuclease T2 family protein [Sulfurovum riftiae]|uniref:ribonuclease T2 family protein n=1 Tax=Sulfurovum riftiae TaxID=1630136 RepID=UPI000A4105B8|nr:hypothetical protein [Sulfurovum riftiae]